MSEPDSDRDLDDFLNRRSPLTSAWRDATQQDRAPAALDADLLAAATAAVATAPVQRRRLTRRWQLPVSLAASVLIGIAVLRDAGQDATPDRSIAIAARAAREARIEQAEQAARADAGQRETAAVAAAEVARKRSSSRAADAAVAPAPQVAAPPPPPAAPPPPPPPPPAVAAPAVAAMSAAPSSRAEDKSESLIVQAAPARPGWRAGAYGALRLGQATVDDALRALGPPDIDTATASATAVLPDGRYRHRLFEYGRARDSRGRLRLYFDSTSDTLSSAHLVLEPALPLAVVTAREALDGPGFAQVADAPPCDPQAVPDQTGDAAGWPQLRSWPAQGVQLLLAGPDRVVEISWLERCH